MTLARLAALVAAWYSPRPTALAVAVVAALIAVPVRRRRRGASAIAWAFCGPCAFASRSSSSAISPSAAAARRRSSPRSHWRSRGAAFIRASSAVAMAATTKRRALPVGPDDDPRRVGDEPLLLARAGYPVVVASDRVAAGRALLARNPECDVILSDDGLQHYRLARNVEIAVVDAVRGLGNRCCCRPARCASPLRGWTRSMPSSCCRRPRMLRRRSIRGRFAMRLVGDRFVRVDDPLTSAPASVFARREVHALAGIGHPAAVFRAARGYGHRRRRRTGFAIIIVSSPAISTSPARTRF